MNPVAPIHSWSRNLSSRTTPAPDTPSVTIGAIVKRKLPERRSRNKDLWGLSSLRWVVVAVVGAGVIRGVRVGNKRRRNGRGSELDFNCEPFCAWEFLLLPPLHTPPPPTTARYVRRVHQANHRFAVNIN